MRMLTPAGAEKTASPEREALARAQQRHRLCARAAEEARDADERGAALVREAQEGLEAAQQRLEAAKGDLANSMAAAAKGGPAASASSLSRCRADEAAAIDVLEAAEAAKGSLEASRRDAEREAEAATRYVEQAAGAVVLESLGPLLAEAVEMQQRLIRFRLGLRWLMQSRVVAGNPALAAFMERDVFLPGLHGGEADNSMAVIWQRMDAPGPWRAFVHALRGDPDAPAPSVVGG
jgi:hypothetical protein